MLSKTIIWITSFLLVAVFVTMIAVAIAGNKNITMLIGAVALGALVLSHLYYDFAPLFTYMSDSTKNTTEVRSQMVGSDVYLRGEADAFLFGGADVKECLLQASSDAFEER